MRDLNWSLSVNLSGASSSRRLDEKDVREATSELRETQFYALIQFETASLVECHRLCRRPQAIVKNLLSVNFTLEDLAGRSLGECLADLVNARNLV